MCRFSSVSIAVAHRVPLELIARRQDRVRRAVDRVVGRQQPPFLGGEQDDEPHHHGDGRVVDLRRRRRAEEPPSGRRSARENASTSSSTAWRTCSPSFPVTSACAAPLSVEQRLERFLLGDAEEPPRAEQRDERVEQQPLLAEEARRPDGVARRSARRRPDEREPVGVGHERQRHVDGAAQQRRPLDRRGRPVGRLPRSSVTGRRSSAVRSGQRIPSSRARSGPSFCGSTRTKSGRSVVWRSATVCVRPCGMADASRSRGTKAEQVAQNPLQPAVRDARHRSSVRRALTRTSPRSVAVDRRNAVREHTLQDRKRQERADGLDERQPVVVDRGDGAVSVHDARPPQPARGT